MRALYQFMNTEVTRLRTQVHGHGDRHHLDRLPGLVVDRPGDVEEVRVADRHRERAVLGQVQVLVGERRDHDPHRLRDHDQPQRPRPAQAERAGGLPLALADREDARAHDLGDVGGGVDREAQRERHELGLEHRPAARPELAHLRQVEGERPAHHEVGDRDQQQEADHHQAGGHALAGPHPVAPHRAEHQRDRHHDRDGHDRHDAEARLRQGPRHVEPARVEERQAHEGQALPRLRQDVDQDGVDEQELEEDRDVAHRLDVDGGEARHEPVARQAGDADGEADDGRQDDADDGDHDRVDEADDEGAGEGVGGRVVDRGLRDREARGALQEAEARRDAEAREVDERVVDEVGDGAEDDDDGDELVDDRADARVVVEGRLRRLEARARHGGHRRVSR